MIEEFLSEEEKEDNIPKGKIIKIPAEVLKKLDKPQRLAAESGQESAENEHFLVVKQTENSYALIIKDYNLLGRKIRILLGNEPIYDDILDSETLFVEVEEEVSPTLLADLLGRGVKNGGLFFAFKTPQRGQNSSLTSIGKSDKKFPRFGLERANLTDCLREKPSSNQGTFRKTVAP